MCRLELGWKFTCHRFPLRPAPSPVSKVEMENSATLLVPSSSSWPAGSGGWRGYTPAGTPTVQPTGVRTS